MTEHILSVFLHQRPIGSLVLLPGEQILFAFTDAYIHDRNRPTLSLSFKNAAGDLITDINPTKNRLPPFFSNLLPEGPMRRYLAKRAGVNENREFFLLRALGKDLPGGIRVAPANGGDISMEIPVGDRKDGKGVVEKALRFSLAGVQLKFSGIMEASGGLTIPAEGCGGAWIVKLPSLTFPAVPENEFAMMNLAAGVGITVPEVRLTPVQRISGLPEEMRQMTGNAFVIRRFDRTDDGSLLHVEDFAQVFGVYPEKKYDRANYHNIAQVLVAESGLHDIDEFVKRFVFSVLIGNADMHLKNWSLMYPDKRRAALAPAYDMVSTLPYINDTDTALKLAKSRDMKALSFDRLSYFAAKVKLPQKRVLETARETVERFMDIWKHGEYVNELPFVRDAIRKHLKTIVLVKEVGA